MPHPSITAKTYPHKPAVIMGASGEMVTFAQLDRRSNKGAQLFRSLGLQGRRPHRHDDRELPPVHRDRVGSAAQRPDLHAHQHPPEKKRDGLHPGELRRQTLYRLARAAGCRRKVRERPPAVEHFYMVGGIADGYESWEEAVDAQPPTPIADESNGVPMLYSSGTTGQPKGVFVTDYARDVNTPPFASPPSAPGVRLRRGDSVSLARRRCTTRRRCTGP